MARKCQRREALLPDDDSQFLLQLADQAQFRPFASLNLAAGELPKPRHRFTFRALRKQHTSIGVDQGAGGNQHEFDAHGPSSL